MDSELLTLSKIFSERLFRIPDYQRGYAWETQQLDDFWEDLERLAEDHNHYANVLTLEEVPEQVYQNWDDDLWMIGPRNYKAYYVVDGQQRLTTSIILIQVILEKIKEGQRLNYQSKDSIRQKFIFDSRDGGVVRSYIFGYERDNPSFYSLKRDVFGEKISETTEETIYSRNLKTAKSYFQERIKEFDISDLENLYKKITQKFLFNIFSISKEIDVCVAFETMNNRGKRLSILELLKNRLIYLSIKFEESQESKSHLRRLINDCWKDIYHYIGKSTRKELSDDDFLNNHYLFYFKENEDIVKNNINFYNNVGFDSNLLLERHFIVKNIIGTSQMEPIITISSVRDYVISLRESVKVWYQIFNPFESSFPDNIKIWLDKINRVGDHVCMPLVLSLMVGDSNEASKILLLKSIERFYFISYFIGRGYEFYIQKRAYYAEFIQFSISLYSGLSSCEDITKSIDKMTESVISDRGVTGETVSRFRNEGFYKWPMIRYFLYEYNLSLQESSKENRKKISWPEFNEPKQDFRSVEHIYPKQARHNYWVERFEGLNQKQKEIIRDSLGNLLPLSSAKNSRLQNKPFPEKKKSPDGRKIGYFYGSYAEVEVAMCDEWSPKEILERGIVMLDFLSKRWSIDLGSRDKKIEILGLKFLIS